jgi:hypothetical protein
VDNILKVELDMPNRTTRDYKAPSMMSSLQAALDAAMQEEEEMTFDAKYVQNEGGGFGCVSALPAISVHARLHWGLKFSQID